MAHQLPLEEKHLANQAGREELGDVSHMQTWGGMSFPGFMMLLGSSAAFILFIVLSDSIPSSFSRYCQCQQESSHRQLVGGELMTYVSKMIKRSH
jgi:hypothetical protein